MSLTISEHIEARLTEEARRQGISVEASSERLIDERTGATTATPRTVPELPSWRLGVIGSLHRRNIYDVLDEKAPEPQAVISAKERSNDHGKLS